MSGSGFGLRNENNSLYVVYTAPTFFSSGRQAAALPLGSASLALGVFLQRKPPKVSAPHSLATMHQGNKLVMLLYTILSHPQFSETGAEASY
jgi:hypothetical protein